MNIPRPLTHVPEATVSVNAMMFDRPVEAVNEHLNQIGTEHFIDAADNVDRLGSIEYAVVGGGKDASPDTAILMPAPFANGVWPHIIARAEAISYLAAEAGLRDGANNLVPVVVTASPCVTSSYDLISEERHNVAAGDFSPIATRQLAVLEHVGAMSIAGVVGYSQGAAVAIPTLMKAQKDFDAYSVPAVIGDPPHAAPRGVVALGAAFAKEGATFDAELKKEPIDVVNELFAIKRAAREFNKGVLLRRQENWAMVKGFSRGKLTDDLLDAVWHGIPTTLLHAADSKISPADDVHASVNTVKDYFENKMIRRYLHRLEITGTNHAFGDRIGRFATLCAGVLVPKAA